MSGFFVVQESCRGSQENHGNSQRLLGPPERTERRSGSQLHLAWVEDEAEEISLPIPDTMAQQLETDPWYSAEEKEEGQEMFEDAREGLGEDQDMEWLRDLIANLSPSILRSLQDVSQAEKILRCIHRNVEHVRTEPSRFILRSVLGLLNECCPEETVRTLLRISPSCDNAALAMWEMLLSLPSTSVTVLDRLLSVIQGWRAKCAIPSVSDQSRVAVDGIKALLHAAGCQEHVQNIQKEGGWDMMLDVDTLERGVSLLAREMRKSPAKQQYLLFQHVKEILDQRREWQLNFAMTFYTELLGCRGLGKDQSDVRLLHSYLSHGNQTVRLLALGGLVALAGDPRMAREMRDMLSSESILMCLKDPSTNIRMGALLFFQTMLGLLRRKEASPVALLLVEKLPDLFGDESSQVQELSLSLFGETMKAVARRDKGEMKERIRRVVVFLFLHMNTESRSMTEACGKALLISAKFLGWRRLKRVIKMRKSWLIGETLLKQDRSRVEDYVYFSLPCLWDSRASVREEAIRFMGEPQPPGTLFWQPGPSPRRCPGRQEQPCGCPGQGPGLPLPPLPCPALPCPAQALVAAWLSGSSALGDLPGAIAAERWAGGRAAELAGPGAVLSQCWGGGGLTGALCTGSAVRCLGRNPRKETLEVLWNVIKRLDKDPDASVRSQAGQTLDILQTVQELQRQRWSFRRLCFWR
ncbi:uncharacterized protein [Heliangelus exortis]|uniref:uncharacterized protein n=1 Tax=Heliangelus exortis TaxID=472823 RepID=UPI003A909937